MHANLGKSYSNSETPPHKNSAYVYDDFEFHKYKDQQILLTFTVHGRSFWVHLNPSNYLIHDSAKIHLLDSSGKESKIVRLPQVPLYSGYVKRVLNHNENDMPDEINDFDLGPFKDKENNVGWASIAFYNSE